MTRTFASLAIAFLLTAAASATTIIPMSVERLTEKSEMVVQARALRSWSDWNAAGTRIYTYTEFQVLSAWKGSPRQVFIVKHPGGEAGIYRQKVSGVRGWRPGDESVLFLKRSKAGDGTLVVTGLMQGDFRVTRRQGGLRVSNGAGEVNAFDPRTRSISEYGGASLTLEQLRARVARAVQR